MTILKLGSRGPEVTALQNQLLALGYNIGTKQADGDFGKGTRDAVIAFQRAVGFADGDVDGRVGDKTRTALSAALGNGVQDPPKSAGATTITAAQLRQIMPNAGANADKYVGPLNAAMAKYQINTPARQAAFLAQIGHESGQLSSVAENLNYSAERLAAVWPTRYRTNGKPNALAMQIARNPQAIANNTYANRMGNGSVASGDGWKYRGRGLIQVTGKAGYQAAGRLLGLQLETSPELLEQPDNAALSAAAFWASNNLNALADAGDMRQITKIINGGYNGLVGRMALFDRAKRVLK